MVCNKLNWIGCKVTGSEIIQAQERTTFDELVGHKFKKYRISIATTISRMQNLHSTLMVSG